MPPSRASTVERHSSKALCPFSCLLVILSVQCCQGHCRVDHTIYQRPAWLDHLNDVKDGWAINFFFSPFLFFYLELGVSGVGESALDN